MEKQQKENFIELPYGALKKKYCTIPLFLFQTKLQRCKKNLEEIKNLIKQQGFEYISYVSDERNMIAAKHTQTHRISLIEIKQYNQKSKCVYLSINLTSCLKPEIRSYFQMKTWKFQDKILFQDEKHGKGLVLIQYNFAQSDLRTHIQNLEARRERAEGKQHRKIAKDLIQNLCEYHLSNLIVGCISPETILYENNNWFILCGDYSEHVSQDVGNKLNQPLSTPPNSKYCSPLQYSYQRASVKNNQGSLSKPTHNSFKTDVFCLGLCLVELLVTSVLSRLDIDMDLGLFNGRSMFKSAMLKCNYNFRETFILQPIKGQKGCFRELKVPNYLQLMLEQSEGKRPYIFEISLITNFTGPLLRRFKVPFEQYFKYEVYSIPDSINRKKISYPHASLEYEGEVIEKKYCLNKKTITRDGRGFMSYNGVKSFEGGWRNNQPYGKCQIRFSETLIYEGELSGDKFHGNGSLRFNDMLLGTTQWYKNLPDESYLGLNSKSASSLVISVVNKSIEAPILQFPNGIYLILGNQQIFEGCSRASIDQTNDIQREYKIYYRPKWNHQFDLGFNLFYLGKFANSMIKWIVSSLIESSSSVIGIEIKGIVNQSELNLKPCQQLKFKIILNEVERKITIVTGLDCSFNFLLDFICECSRKCGSNLKLKYLIAENIKLIRDQHIREIVNQVHSIQQIRIPQCQYITDYGFLSIMKKNMGENSVKVLDLSQTKIENKSINQLIYWSGLVKVKELYLKSCKRITEQKLYELLHSEKVSHLEKLDLSYMNISNKILQKISENPSLKSLVTLNLDMCFKLTENSLSAMLNHPNLKKLKHLSFRSCSFKDLMLEKLIQSQFELQSLCLAGCINLTLEGLWNFFSNKKMKSIKRLNLSSLSIDDRFLSYLSQARYSTLELTQFIVQQCRFVTDKGVNSLIKSRVLQNVEILNLKKTRINNSTLQYLSLSNNHNLKRLELSKCSNLTDEGLQKFVQSSIFNQINYLDLSSTSVSSLFVTALRNCSATICLKYLNLSDCKNLSELNIDQLLTSKHILNLDQLDLSNTLISDPCLVTLRKHTITIPTLTKMKLHNCKNITDSTRKQNSQISSLISYVNMGEESEENVSDLCRFGYLLKMNELRLDNQTKKLKQLNQIFKSSHIVNLGVLKFTFVGVDDFFDTVFQGLVFLNMLDVSFYGCQFEERKLIDFLKCKSASKIKKLDLSWTECSSQVLSKLIQSQIRLEVLNLSKCIKINDRGLVKYLSSPAAQTLAQIDLRSTLITNNTIEAIFSSKYLQNLKKLIVRACQNIRYVGFKNILNSKCSKSLEYLDISWTNIQGGIWSNLCGSKSSCNLTTIIAAGLKFTESELTKFLVNQNSSCLTFLDISFTEVGLDFFAHSSKFKCLKSLHKLDLKGTQPQIIKKGWQSLAKNSHIREVTISDFDSQLEKVISLMLDSSKEIEKIIVSGSTTQKIEQVKRVLKTNLIYNEDENLELS